MPDGLEVRIAHLEGAYEQFDRRLASVEVRLGSVEAEIRTLRKDLLDRMDSQFRWILGVQIASWLSLIGAMLTFLFRR